MTGSVLCLEFRCRINQEILVLTFSDLGTPTMAPFKSSKLYPFDCCLYLFFHPQVARFSPFPNRTWGRVWWPMVWPICFHLVSDVCKLTRLSLAVSWHGCEMRKSLHQFERWGTATNESRSRSSIEVEVNMSLSVQVEIPFASTQLKETTQIKQPFVDPFLSLFILFLDLV